MSEETGQRGRTDRGVVAWLQPLTQPCPAAAHADICRAWGPCGLPGEADDGGLGEREEELARCPPAL